VGRREPSSAQVSVQKTDANLGHQATPFASRKTIESLSTALGFTAPAPARRKQASVPYQDTLTPPLKKALALLKIFLAFSVPVVLLCFWRQMTFWASDDYQLGSIRRQKEV
jgi:hypothetical protein